MQNPQNHNLRKNGNFGDKYNIEKLFELLIAQSGNVEPRMLTEQVSKRAKTYH